MDKQKIKCHDCGKILKLEDDKIKDGHQLVYDHNDRKVVAFKCIDCFNKPDGKVLKNFQETEVYSRVVGYMRPIKQWNIGKKKEYEDRKIFKNNNKKNAKREKKS